MYTNLINFFKDKPTTTTIRTEDNHKEYYVDELTEATFFLQELENVGKAVPGKFFLT